MIWHWIGINDKWNHISKKCDISKEEFLTGVHFILDSTYFSFDNTIYKQNFGTPMGSPLSPIVVNLVIRRLEGKVLMLFQDVYFFIIVMLMICVRWYLSKIDSLLNVFNSFHPRLQFTLEIGDESLNFLDVIIIKNNTND